jgi:hypothetical protein
MWFALDRQVREEKQGRSFPVIPILLPGADPTPGFLFSSTWIDLRSGSEDIAAAETLNAFDRAINAKGVPGATERAAALCPYRGLEAFREEDTAFFAGRSAFARNLLNFTLAKDLVVVVGPSGSGKSSIVQAGLVPLLRRQLPPAISWDALTFSPGGEPFHRLASALIPLLEPGMGERERLAEAEALGRDLNDGRTRVESAINRVIEKSNGTGRLLVIADQFEELFTLTPDPSQRPFAQALLGALGKARFSLLISLRADFYSQIITLHRELSDRLAPAQVNIGALTRQELEESIISPAGLVGLEFEPGLVERILDDVGNEPGNLPLLEFALTRLWSKRQDRTLTNAAYNEIGGVTGALAQRAEAEFERFTLAEQTAARRLFSRLVRVARPEEGSEDTRQRLTLEAADAVTDKVVLTLAAPEVRLLVIGQPETLKQIGNRTVEVAHEALIRNWERLRTWLNEDREFLLWRQRTHIQLEEWEEHHRDESFLLRGAALSQAERWLIVRPSELVSAEQEFIKSSVDLRERERANEDKRHRIVRWSTRFVVLMLSVLAAGFAWQWRTSVDERDKARSRELSTLAESVDNDWNRFDLAGLLTAGSLRAEPSLEMDRLARRLLDSKPVPIWAKPYPFIGKDPVFSPDGKLLAFGNSVIDAKTGAILFQSGDPDSSVAFTNDGLLVQATTTGIRLLKIPSGEEIRYINVAPGGDAPEVSSQGNFAAVHYRDHVEVYDMNSGKSIGRVSSHKFSRVSVGSEAPLVAQCDSPLSNQQPVWIQNPRSGQVLLRFVMSGQCLSLALSGNDQLIASAAGLQQASNGTQLTPPFTLNGGKTVFVLAFSRNSWFLLVTQDDVDHGKTEVYESQYGTMTSTLNVTRTSALLLSGRPGAISNDGGLIVSVPPYINREGGQLSVTPTHSNELVRLEVSKILDHQNDSYEWSASWTDDLHRVAVNWLDGGHIFDLQRHEQIWPTSSDALPGRVAISADGSSAAVMRFGSGKIEIIETTGWKVQHEINQAGEEVSVSPHGRYVLVANNPYMGWRGTELFEVSSGRRVWHRLDPWQWPIYWSSDETFVMDGGSGPIIRVADGSDAVQSKLSAARHYRDSGQNFMNSHSFGSDAAHQVSPDGRTFAYGSAVYSLESGAELHEWNTEGTPIGYRFSPDGRFLYSISADRAIVVRKHALDRMELLNELCAVVGRDLAPQERIDYKFKRDDHPCGSKPDH